MVTFWLRCKAPFAAYRPMQAGSLRATATVMPYSSAWGLVLNLAGIETRTRLDLPTTLISADAPPLRLALGLPGAVAGVGSLYQQGHGYPVGNTSKALKALTKGAKYHIAPVRRELLVGLDVVVGVGSEDSLADRVRCALQGRRDWRRYGLPFAGDNNLLFDDIACVTDAPSCRWYVPVQPQDGPRAGAARLTRAIDRADSSRTESDLVAPQSDAASTPPPDAWVWTPRPPASA